MDEEKNKSEKSFTGKVAEPNNILFGYPMSITSAFNNIENKG